jgi:hypothetical protein
MRRWASLLPLSMTGPAPHRKDSTGQTNAGRGQIGSPEFHLPGSAVYVVVVIVDGVVVVSVPW